MARILLTGAYGFVGGAVLRRLLADGHRVTTLGRAKQTPQGAAAHHACDLLTADNALLRAVCSGIDAEGMIHAAWYTNHADYLTAGINHDWLASSMRLFEAFRAEGGMRIVGLGTCAEYAPLSGRYAEGVTPLAPVTLYGECKKALSEQLMTMNDTAWARLFFIYGQGDRAERLIPHLIARAAAGATVSAKFGELQRDYIHVDDLAAHITAIMTSNVTGAINIGTGRAVRLSTIAAAIAKAAGRPELVRPSRVVDDSQPRVIEADMTRFHSIIGAVKTRSVTEGLTSLVQEEL